MRKQKNWESLRQVLDVINATDDALVQRNFEKMSDEQYFMEGHDDIDFLCRNPAEIRKKLDVRNNWYAGSPHHFFVNIRNTPVKIGLRYVGDGYLDANWEDAMLQNKVQTSGGFFIPNSEDYFYSLLYHALLQKREFSEDYRRRLGAMGEPLGLRLREIDDYRKALFQYLEREGYSVPYPIDPTIPIHFDSVPASLLKPKTVWLLRKALFSPKVGIARISHIPHALKGVWRKR